jgi:hypothetical protein
MRNGMKVMFDQNINGLMNELIILFSERNNNDGVKNLTEFDTFLSEAKEKMYANVRNRYLQSIKLPEGQELCSLDLKINGIANFVTRLGPIYTLVDAGQANALTDDDYNDLNWNTFYLFGSSELSESAQAILEKFPMSIKEDIEKLKLAIALDDNKILGMI